MQDSGELLAWAVAGCGLVLALAWVWRRPVRGDLGLLVLFGGATGLLAVFGIGGDMLHMALPDRFDRAAGTLEDGGELIVIALLTALAIGVLRLRDTYRRSLPRT